MKRETPYVCANDRRRRRKRGTARLFVLGAAFAVATGTGRLASPAQAAETPVATGYKAWRDDALRASRSSSEYQTPSAGVPAGNVERFQFQIPAGPLSAALPAFEAVTRVKVTLALESIGMIQSPGVTGLFTADEALQALLTGTGVASRFNDPRTAVLELSALAESVEVVGRVPTVTSPKYVETLRNIPQTIALIPKDVIEAQGAFTLSDALRNVPGITLQAGEGGGASSTAGDMFNMRGFNAANSLFVDGVRDDGLIARDVFNLEQVEVFMGPTGSDVGRGTAAGYINIQTKSPLLQSEHSALLSYGSADQKRATFDLNIPLSPGQPNTWLGKSAVRLNALVQDGGTPGRDAVDSSRKAVAPSLALGLGTATRVALMAQAVWQDNVPDYGIPGAAWMDEPLAPTTVRAAGEVNQSNYYGAVDFDYDDATQNSYTARIEHDVNARLSLRNQARYNRTHREAVISAIQNVAAFNPATNLVTLARQGNERENTIVSNQTSLVGRFSTGQLRHASTLGVECTLERQVAPTLAGLGTIAPVDIFTPNPHAPVAGFAPARTAAFSRGQTDTIALYGFDTVDLGARWQVTGGARVERYDASFRAVDAAGVPTTDLEAADSLVSGKVGLVYRLTPFANFYVSYGTTVTPPGTANFTLSAQANNQNNPSVDPQRSTNYEVGGKWDVAAGRLSLNTAVFRTDNTNVIFTVDATTIPPLFNQDDAQRVDGFTFGALGRINDEWEVLSNVAYLDATQRSQNSATNGNRLTLTPRWSGSLWTTYRLPVALTLGGGIRFTDSVFINAANTIQSPAYHVVDALAEYEVNAHLSLRANLYNVTDETYIRNVNNNGGRYNPGQARAALLTLNLRF